MSETVQSLYEKAVDQFVQAQYDEAIKTLRLLIEKDPVHRDGLESLGMIHYRMGKIDDAIHWTLKLSEAYPDYAMAHTNLSIFYMKKGMKEKAEEEKAKAVVLNFGKKP